MIAYVKVVVAVQVDDVAVLVVTVEISLLAEAAAGSEAADLERCFECRCDINCFGQRQSDQKFFRQLCP